MRASYPSPGAQTLDGPGWHPYAQRATPPMYVLGGHVLVVHADDVPVVAADIALLVLVGALQSLEVIELGRRVRG